MIQPISNNPLRTRAEVEQGLCQLLEPLLARMSEGKARLRLGDNGALYPLPIQEMEAWSRPLWAIFPLLKSGSENGARYWRIWSEGLRNGTDPRHPEYWGDIGAYDQRMVEMAAIGFGMALCPTAFWQPFSAEEKERIVQWLNQINRYDMPRNNWRYFRVMVNTGFCLSGLEYPQAVMDEDFALMEEHYEADGWYFDEVNQRDYYSIWEFQLDGLLYALLMRKRDPKRSAALMERARQFAPRFAAWFDISGEAIAYGRSLTYRFAQSAFWSGLALAELETDAIGYGEMKRLWLQNLRKWVKRPIFRQDGTLSVGYGYENLVMADEYNAPGSPYWGMKAFMALALPESHPFWQAEERAPETPPRFLEEHSRMLLVRNERGSHVQAFTAGNHCEGHAHGECKYEKFVYSTLFGFSVPKGIMGLDKGGFDSALAVSDDGRYWRSRFGCLKWEVTEACVRFTWQPYSDVTIETTIAPRGEWHTRTHRVTTGRALYLAEGGFAISRDGDTAEELTVEADERGVCARASWGVSGIRALEGWNGAAALNATPNSNLLYRRTLIPTLRAEVQPGSYVLRAAVLGTDGEGAALWNDAIALMEE